MHRWFSARFFWLVLAFSLLPVRLPAPPELPWFTLRGMPPLALDEDGLLRLAAFETFIAAWKEMIAHNASVVETVGNHIARQRAALRAEAKRVRDRVGENLFSTLYTTLAEMLEGPRHPFGAFAQKFFPVCAGEHTAAACAERIRGRSAAFDGDELTTVRRFQEQLNGAVGDAEVLQVRRSFASWSRDKISKLKGFTNAVMQSGYPAYMWVNETDDDIAVEYLSLAINFQDLLRLGYAYPPLPHFTLTLQPTDISSRKAYRRNVATAACRAKGSPIIEIEPIRVGEFVGAKDGYTPVLLNAIADAPIVEYLLVGTEGDVPLLPVNVTRPWPWGSRMEIRPGRTVRLFYKTGSSTDFMPNLGYDGQVSRTRFWYDVASFDECRGLVMRTIGMPEPVPDVPPVAE